MRKRSSQCQRLSFSSKGFSLVELVMVALVISILGVFALPSVNPSTNVLDVEVRRLLNFIRYTQALSITRGERYRWVKTAATTYQIIDQDGVALVLPSGGTTLTFNTGVIFGTLTNLPSSLIAFDASGTPYTTSTIPGTALAATATIPIKFGTTTRTISIVATTGYGSIS